MLEVTEALEGLRHQTFGEEVANGISHGIGLIAALAGAPILILSAVQKGDAMAVVSVSIFAASMVLLYLSSMIYHCLPVSRAKNAFHILDHIAIFLLIAGTYTPFMLCVLNDTLGWTLFGLVWAVAFFGIITKLVPNLRDPKLSIALYMGMGWMILLVILPLYRHLHWEGLSWVIAGGLAYTLGVVFYVAKAKYAHFVWHLFTIAGTTCHFFAIFWYVV